MGEGEEAALKVEMVAVVELVETLEVKVVEELEVEHHVPHHLLRFLKLLVETLLLCHVLKVWGL